MSDERSNMPADRAPSTPADWTDLFRALGVRLPIRAGGRVNRGLYDGDGDPLFMGVPSTSLSTDRARALAFAAAVNAACGVSDEGAIPIPKLQQAAE